MDLELLNKRVLDLAAAQSEDIAGRLRDAGVHIVEGHGRLVDAHTIAVDDVTFYGDVILLATEPPSGAADRGSGRRAHPSPGSSCTTSRNCPSG